MPASWNACLPNVMHILGGRDRAIVFAADEDSQALELLHLLEWAARPFRERGFGEAHRSSVLPPAARR